MEEKIKTEEGFLYNTEELIQDLLKNHFDSNECKLDAFTKAKIKRFTKRMIDQEVEYLNQDPDSYFELYGEDHFKN